MDIQTLGAAIAILKSAPDSSITKAEQAALRAEEAAQVAIEHSIGASVDGTTLVISDSD